MKFRKFNTKIPPDGEIEATALLFHAVDALDEAILVAVQSKDAGQLEKLYEKMLDASDRLISVSMFELDEGPVKDEPKQRKPGIGFDTTATHTIKGDTAADD